MKSCQRFLLLSLIYIAAGTSVFAAATTNGLGGLANDMMEPVGLLSDFVYAACVCIGGGFLFASIIKYNEHRRSPLMVPISTVVFLVIAGSFLLLIPVMGHYYDGALGFSFYKK
jgi:uncharacterized membrane protein YeiH